MKKQYAIEHVGTPDCTARLDKALKPDHGNSRPAENIQDMLFRGPLRVQTIIFEDDYIDADYQDEFVAFYAKAFKSYPQRCCRLHFFSCVIPKDSPWRFSQFAKDYKGFMVVRPTDLQRVGRTILQPPISDPNAQFITCQAEYEAHVLGEPLTVKGMPYIQQDTQVGACAQACLWMVSRYMSKRYRLRLYRPSEINTFAKATLGLGRRLPAERGLILEQILEALHSMGLSAVAYHRPAMKDYSKHVETAFPTKATAPGEKVVTLEEQQTIKLADIAYRYVESGLPVLLATKRHALVAIGHTYRYGEDAKVAIQRIPAFIVNNDNDGCYRKLPIYEATAPYNMADVQALIAISPDEATLCGEVAESHAETYVRLLFDKFKLKDPLIGTRPEFAACFDKLEYRTYLMLSTELQRDLWREHDNALPNKDVASTLVQLDMPKYVWVTEISSPELLNQPDKKDRKCLGRVLVDSTAPTSTDAVIAMHFADMLLVNDRQGREKMQLKHYPNSTPYPHKLW